MHFSQEPEGIGRQARLVTLCFACLGLLLLNLPEAGYSAAIMVKQQVNLNGNGISIDSYNSNDPNKSTNGQWDPGKAGSCGDIICINGIIDGVSNSIPVGNLNVFGRAYIASGSDVNLGTNGAIGTYAWQSNNVGIEHGYLVPNTNFPFANISLPDYSGFPSPVAGSVVTTNSGVPVTNSYDDVLWGGNYFANSLGNTIVTSPSTLVLPNGYAIDNLTIVPGASLTVYLGGAHSVSISGNNTLNQSGLPSALLIYCTSDVTSIALSGNAPLSLVLFAPNANAACNGGGNNSVDISGAIMANSLTLNGHFDFHFDEALIQQGIIPPSPSLAASLMAPTMSGGGQFQFGVSGVPGFSYAVEASTNLTDWLPIFTNASPFTFTDTNASPPAQNFYRAVYNQ